MPENDWKNGGFGVYVHWPFCLSKCPYCDFNSHVSDTVDPDRWRLALLQEIETTAARVPNRTVDTIFFGGGTPSLMPPETVAAVVQKIASVWTLNPNVEISLEANPTSVETSRFLGYRDAGVNRISMGIQSLRDQDLRRLGRLHTSKEAMQAFEIARKNFPRVSFDLIYARQEQTLKEWEEELSQALSLAVDHLSLYQLTIEDGTRFGDLHSRGKLRGLPKESLSSDLYKLTQDVCGRAGLPSYEISNHAASDAQCNHNLVYWRYGDYAGIGPGGHGRLSRSGKRIATASKNNPEKWLSAVETTGTGSEDVEIISCADQGAEYLMMSLRLSEGTNIARFEALSGKELPQTQLDFLISQGFVQQTPSHLFVTTRGRLVLNSVLKELLVT